MKIDIERGELVRMMGKQGQGKKKILMMIEGFENKSRGKINVEGK